MAGERKPWQRLAGAWGALWGDEDNRRSMSHEMKCAGERGSAKRYSKSGEHKSPGRWRSLLSRASDIHRKRREWRGRPSVPVVVLSTAYAADNDGARAAINLQHLSTACAADSRSDITSSL